MTTQAGFPKRRAFVVAFVLLAFVGAQWRTAKAASAPGVSRFVILGDRTGETVPGVFEQVLRQAAAEQPAALVTTGDTIQGMSDTTAEPEWREARRLFSPYGGISLYLVPGNHDVWSDRSASLYSKYSGHPLHYSFDCGPAHFTVLDNSQSDELGSGELEFLEQDLKANAEKPVKFIISHRPSWIFRVMLRNGDFPLHRLARKYGVGFVIAGHVHQLLHLELDGVTYLSMPSGGGHLRASGKYEDGWFFGYTAVEIRKNEPNFRFHEIHGKETGLKDWGTAGLVSKNRN